MRDHAARPARSITATGPRCDRSVSLCDALVGDRAGAGLAGRRGGSRPPARARDRRLRRRRRGRCAPAGARRWPGRRGAHPFALSEAFGAWRVVARDTAGRSTCCRCRRLDRDRPRAARLHGQRDRRAAERRRARRPVRRRSTTCAAARCGWCPRDAFADDPLRALRLARLACELGFEVEPGTVAAAAASAPALVGVAPERVFAELKRIVTRRSGARRPRADGRASARPTRCCPS